MKRVTRRIIAWVWCAVFLGWLGAPPAHAAKVVSVVKDDVNLRSGPATSYEVLWRLPKGYPLKVLSTQGKWYKVTDFEGDKGWIYASLVSARKHVIVKVKEANLRTGPGTSYAKKAKVEREVILRELARRDGWIKVSHPRIEGEAWIMA